MAQLLSWSDAVDIGHGRGRLAREAAASLRRVDRDFGRVVDVNEAWRSPEQANANYARYQAYLRDPKNNPWAPIALRAEDSIHCRGYALDTDDTSAAQMRIWNDHGWYWTVYRDGKLVERWHLEYFRDRDNHRNDPAPAGSDAEPFKEDVMNADQERLLKSMATDVANIKGFVYDGGSSVSDPNYVPAPGSLLQVARNIAAHVYAGGTDAAKADYLAAPGTIYHLLKRRVLRGLGARPTKLPTDGSNVFIEQIQDAADTNTLLRALTEKVGELADAVAKITPTSAPDESTETPQ